MGSVQGPDSSLPPEASRAGLFRIGGGKSIVIVAVRLQLTALSFGLARALLTPRTATP